MSIHFSAAVWAITDGTDHTLKLVLLKLADSANDEGHCWPSISRIAAETWTHRATVHRKIADLQSLGILRRDRDQQDRLAFWLDKEAIRAWNGQTPPMSQPATPPEVAQRDTPVAQRDTPVAACDIANKRTVNEPPKNQNSDFFRNSDQPGEGEAKQLDLIPAPPASARSKAAKAPAPDLKPSDTAPKDYRPETMPEPFWASPALRAAWESWHDGRKTKPTVKAATLTAAKLAKHPMPVAIAALLTAAERGWTGVFPESTTEHDARQKSASKPQPALDTGL